MKPATTALLFLIAQLLPRMAYAADCHHSGIEDTQDFAVQGLEFPEIQYFTKPSGLFAAVLRDVNADNKTDIIYTVLDSNLFQSYVAKQSGNGFETLPILQVLFIPQFIDVGFSNGANKAAAFNQGDGSDRSGYFLAKT